MTGFRAGLTIALGFKTGKGVRPSKYLAPGDLPGVLTAVAALSTPGFRLGTGTVAFTVRPLTKASRIDMSKTRNTMTFAMAILW
jgi:hypothetical protein